MKPVNGEDTVSPVQEATVQANDLIDEEASNVVQASGEEPVETENTEAEEGGTQEEGQVVEGEIQEVGVKAEPDDQGPVEQPDDDMVEKNGNCSIELGNNVCTNETEEKPEEEKETAGETQPDANKIEATEEAPQEEEQDAEAVIHKAPVQSNEAEPEKGETVAQPDEEELEETTTQIGDAEEQEEQKDQIEESQVEPIEKELKAHKSVEEEIQQLETSHKNTKLMSILLKLL